MHQILKVIAFPLQEGRELNENLSQITFRKSKQIIRLHSTKEANDFVAQIEPYIDRKTQFSNMKSIAGKRYWTAIRR
jgi:hypothetical protein